MPNFGLNQGTSDQRQHAEIFVPGCGHRNYANGPVIHIEIENDKPVLYIWADINQEDYTHRISLEHAQESNREVNTEEEGDDHADTDHNHCV